MATIDRRGRRAERGQSCRRLPPPLPPATSTRPSGSNVAGCCVRRRFLGSSASMLPEVSKMSTPARTPAGVPALPLVLSGRPSGTYSRVPSGFTISLAKEINKTLCLKDIRSNSPNKVCCCEPMRSLCDQGRISAGLASLPNRSCKSASSAFAQRCRTGSVGTPRSFSILEIQVRPKPVSFATSAWLPPFCSLISRSRLPMFTAPP